MHGHRKLQRLQVNVVILSGIVQDGTRLERLNQGAGVNLGRVRIVTKSDAGADVTREIDLTGL
jgi:hypothetical protein